MALNNSQYDEIFRSYDAKQLKAQHQLEERTKAAYERSPELKALDASIAEISVASARRLLDGDSSALTELKAELKNLRTRKKALMKELSLPENYFEPVYECPDCKDTGYIDGKPCHCFKQQAIDLIYTQSNIKDILARENFSTLSLDYYSDSNIREKTLLEAYQSPLFQAYKEGQPFNSNYLRPCPLLDNAGRLAEIGSLGTKRADG